jgi:hypothetical protein
MRADFDLDQCIARRAAADPRPALAAQPQNWPSRVPGGMLTSSKEPSGSVICFFPPLTASRKSSSSR